MHPYLFRTTKQFSLLKPHGKIGAIAPEGLLTGNSKRVVDFRTFVAERGHWEFIGSPFKDTTTKCIALTLENISIREMLRRWEPTNGYESSFQEALEIALGCDQDWHDLMSVAKNQPEEQLEPFLGDALDSRINPFIQKDYGCFVYNPKVKGQLLRSAIRELTDE
jgi:hypothetical protein